MSALITDADQYRCITVARSLVKKGINVVIAGEEHRENIAFRSTYYNKCMTYPPPENTQLFIETLMKIAKGHNVLIPLHEKTIVPMSKYSDKFKKIIKIPIPSYQIVRAALDKAETINIAHELGIPTPHTYFISDLNEIELLAKNLNYPVVIKLREEMFSVPPRYVYANSPHDLLIKYQLMHKRCDYPLIQELIHGIGYGFFTLFNESSKPLAFFCHRRIREYPISGGPSTYCESVYEPKIIEYGLNLLRRIRWFGVAMVEFRRDFRDGEFKLMEINPRFWGSLPLSIASGVDFPYLLYQMALGNRVEPCTKYKIGVKCRFLYSDFLALKQALRRSKHKLGYLRDFIGSFCHKNVHYELH